MAGTVRVDVCILGGGPGASMVAAGAAQVGASAAVVAEDPERKVPPWSGRLASLALHSAGAVAHGIRRAPDFGVSAGPVAVDGRGVFSHVREAIAALAASESAERLEGMGVRVVRGPGRFVSPAEVATGETRIRARRFVIATGSAPALPELAGLASVPYLTGDTLSGLDSIPGRLAVIGGGPAGCGLAQAFRRLGAEVDLIERDRLLGREDPELVAVIRRRLVVEGVRLHEGVRAVAVTAIPGGCTVQLEKGEVGASALLVATGRRPLIDVLGLEAAGIARTPGGGIAVDSRLRTSNRRVFAIGAAAGLPSGPLARHHAAVVLRNALFRLPSRTDAALVPRLACCDPELAQAGLTEAEARQAGLRFTILRWGLADNDRALAGRDAEGFTKAIVAPDGRILGAGVVATHAGEILPGWLVAIAGNLKAGRLAGVIAPDPTRAEVIQQAAASFHAHRLSSPWTRRLVRLLRLLP